MVQPNDFEKEILGAAFAAQRFHLKMTGGQYLWYSHESYLQNFVAVELFKKTSHCVYIDPSPKKLRESSASSSKRPPPNVKQRFDLVFWLKSDARVKAILEIKVAWGKKPVMDDIRKVSTYLNTKDGQGVTGYVLYYTDHRRNKRWKGKDSRFIGDRFKSVDEEVKSMRGRDRTAGLRHGLFDYVCDRKNEDPWGVALYRC